jgi:hypothetical protein
MSNKMLGTMSGAGAWKCPDDCEIDHVLVCGGDLGDAETQNKYFQMKLDGAYTNLNEDGSLGVPTECHEHADGGCCTEPICPVCGAHCVRGTIEGNN